MTGPRAIHAGGANGRYIERRKKPKKPAAGAQLTSLIAGRLDCPRCGPETLFVSRAGVVLCVHCSKPRTLGADKAAPFNGPRRGRTRFPALPHRRLTLHACGHRSLTL